MTMTSQKSVRLMTPGQFKTLAQIVTGKIPANMSFVEAEKLIKRIGRATQEMFMDLQLEIGEGRAGNIESEIITQEYGDACGWWTTFYKRHFSLDLDFADLVIPERPAKDNWTLIIVPAGLKLKDIYGACLKAFNNKCSRSNNDLDQDVYDVAIRPIGTYAIWVQSCIEVPVEQIKKFEDNNGITLKELMLLELAHFDGIFGLAGKHLSPWKWTCCSGSRLSNGFVPDAYWYDGNFWVGWFFTGSGCKRYARAVSL